MRRRQRKKNLKKKMYRIYKGKCSFIGIDTGPIISIPWGTADNITLRRFSGGIEFQPQVKATGPDSPIRVTGAGNGIREATREDMEKSCLNHLREEDGFIDEGAEISKKIWDSIEKTKEGR